MGRKRKYPADWGIVEGTPESPPADASQIDDLPKYAPKDETKDTHSSIICKLTRVCRVPQLIDEIKQTCVIMRQVQLEGWHLANLHVRRCLEEGAELPEIDHMFFYRCCVATLGNIEARDRHNPQVQHPRLHETFTRYWAGREAEVAFASQSIVNGTQMIHGLAKAMAVNSQNLLTIHFRRRLHLYVRFRYAPKGKLEMTYKATKKLVDSCFRVKVVRELDEQGHPTSRNVKVWDKWDDTDDPEEKELREWLEVVPWRHLIKQNTALFLRKLSDMLTWMESFVEEHPKRKGTKLYSLLPVGTSYQALYVAINGTTLHGLFSRILAQPKVEEFLKNELNIVPSRKITSRSQRVFTHVTFQTHRKEILRRVFDVDQFVTNRRSFADEIKTNGYAASVTMIRPVTTTSVVVVPTASKKKKRGRRTMARLRTFRRSQAGGKLRCQKRWKRGTRSPRSSSSLAPITPPTCL